MAEQNMKLPSRSYWEGFKARNEALWDKVKNNTFVNMVFPVKEVSEGNTEAMLPLVVPGSNAALNAAKVVIGKSGQNGSKIAQQIQKIAIKEAKGKGIPITEDVMSQAAREQWVNPQNYINGKNGGFRSWVVDDANADRSGRFIYNRIFKKQQGGTLNYLDFFK